MGKLQKYKVETSVVRKNESVSCKCSAVGFFNAGTEYVMIDQFKLKPNMSWTIGDSCATDQLEQTFRIVFETGSGELYITKKNYDL